MKAKIKEWLDAHSLTINHQGQDIQLDDNSGLAIMISDCIQDITPQWVSVNTDLPKENKSYIAALYDGSVLELAFYRCLEYEHWSWHCPLTHDDISGITHWQSLPEPPKTTKGLRPRIEND